MYLRRKRTLIYIHGLHLSHMFTGLIESLAQVVAVLPQGPGVRLTLRVPLFAGDVKIGDSIAINGCCLTVVEISGDTFAFEAGEETLSRTNLGRLQPGSEVNVERSLKVGDRLGGHYVTGHIDGQGTLSSRLNDGNWSHFRFTSSRELTKQMASKGSIAVDGVSLTLVDVDDTGFSVALIPHTLANTTLGKLQPGDAVNLKTDVLAKYVARQLQC